MQTLADIDCAALTQLLFHPSPVAWEDQAFHFPRLHRFADGNDAVRNEPDALHWRAVWLGCTNSWPAA